MTVSKIPKDFLFTGIIFDVPLLVIKGMSLGIGVCSDCCTSRSFHDTLHYLGTVLDSVGTIAVAPGSHVVPQLLKISQPEQWGFSHSLGCEHVQVLGSTVLPHSSSDKRDGIFPHAVAR